MVIKKHEGEVFVGSVLQHTGRPTKGWKNYNAGEVGVDAALSAADAGGLAVSREHDVAVAGSAAAQA